jgi:hypothetical protein
MESPEMLEVLMDINITLKKLVEVIQEQNEILSSKGISIKK